VAASTRAAPSAARLFGRGSHGLGRARSSSRALDGGGRPLRPGGGRALLAGALGGSRRLGTQAADVFLAFALERFRLRLASWRRSDRQQPLCRLLRFDAAGFEPMRIRLEAQSLFPLFGPRRRSCARLRPEPQRVGLRAPAASSSATISGARLACAASSLPPASMALLSG
jgi:hypothetical protein